MSGLIVRYLLPTLLGFALLKVADASDGTLRVLLSGEGEYEAAPHGEGNIYAPCVLIDQGKWKMWYGGQGKDGHDRISYAESVDGSKWTRQGVVLEDKTANHINDPAVIRVGDKYFMYFTRAEKFVIDRIHVATSTDGVTWKRRGMALDAGPEGSWDTVSVGRPAVIYEDGIFKMWYDGRKDFQPSSPVEGAPVSPNSHRYVGYATSNDGLRWQRHGENPVFGNDAGAIDLKRVGNHYLLLYESQGGTRFARSGDGLQWKDAGWLVEKSGGEVDRHGHVTPNLFIDNDGKAWLFFGAARAATWDRNCIAVTKIGLNKLRPPGEQQ